MANESDTLPVNVTVCGFQMSGAEWVHGMIEHILQNSNIGRSPSGSMRALTCVCRKPSECSIDVFDPHRKLIVVVRHAKDTAAALYEHGGYRSSCTFGDFLSHFTGQYGASDISWVDFIVQWQHTIETLAPNQVHAVFFNDIVHDLSREVKNICTFLGIHSSFQFVEQVVSTFDLDKFFSSNEPDRKRRKLSETDSRSNINLYEVGLWKQYFTVRQSEEFDQVLNKALRNELGMLNMARLI